MIEAGEDPRFIARRLIVHASEDVGMADSQALLVAVAAAQAVEHVGLPEVRLNLAHATVYLATAPKSNSVYLAIGRAFDDAPGPEPVPLHLRDASYKGARSLGHGKGYRYPHDFPGHVVAQAYRPARFQGAATTSPVVSATTRPAAACPTPRRPTPRGSATTRAARSTPGPGSGTGKLRRYRRPTHGGIQR